MKLKHKIITWVFNITATILLLGYYYGEEFLEKIGSLPGFLEKFFQTLYITIIGIDHGISFFPLGAFLVPLLTVIVGSGNYLNDKLYSTINHCVTLSCHH